MLEAVRGDAEGDVAGGRVQAGDALGTQARGVSVITGSSRILSRRDELRRLAARCGQDDAMFHLPYLLSGYRLGAKVPSLVVREGGAGELESAVLFHQYVLGGVPSGFFLPADYAGQQNVFAPVASRSAVVAQAAAFLMRRHHALVVLMSLQGGGLEMEQDEALQPFTRATQVRTLGHTLPLAGTVDGTLAALGAHTRRNLRHFRRRVVQELGATFVAAAELTKAEFMAMNRRTLYPAPENVAEGRWTTVREIPGSFVVGLKARDGMWLSVLGGRRYLGWTTVDWQMNADAYPAFSLGTAMRAFLLEDEVARGTRRLTFEGGTPHTMRRAFEQETVSDLLVIRRWLPLWLLRRAVPPRLPAGLLLSEMLLSKTLAWRRGSTRRA